MAQERCPSCFELGYRGGSCGKCGFQTSYDKRSVRALPAGTVLKQRYYLGRILGEGGFGITYKAYDLQTEGICAVKEYAPGEMTMRAADHRKLILCHGEQQEPYRAGLRRFMEEAQILSRLERVPSVVDITDSFQENDTAYFVMEFLDGADLWQIVKASRMRLPVEEITNIILQVATAMDVIHTRTKIIHRDITPHNIYITRDKKVKLIDFGSAKQTVTGCEGGLSVVLNPKFAPPEQFSSRMVQGSYTDVYTLAGTYYYALTGRVLPSAPDRLSGTNYVPLKQMNLGIPDSVSDAVDQALALNVNQRTQTMQEFIQGIAPAAKFSGNRGRDQQLRQEEMRRQREQQLRQEEMRRQREQQLRQEEMRRQKERKFRQEQGRKPCIQIVSGPETGKRWTIPPGVPMKVGRSQQDAQLLIRQPEDVSRVHCQITWLPETGKFRIQDLSTYGTYYRGRRLNKGMLYDVTPPARLMLASPLCEIALGID